MTRAGSPFASASTRLVDQNSFHEIGAISGIAEYDENNELKHLTPANCVFGRGKIDGRTVVVVGDDFTVRGGSADASISTKPLMAEEMAHDFRLPIIRVIEGSGGGGSVKTIETKGAANLPGGVGGTRWYWYTTANMARVPVVGLGLGSVAGLGAARLAATHYSVMTKNSAMFVAGPPVVKRLGQDLTKQELGGADIQTRAGGVDDAVDTEEEAFERARRFLSYLPSSVYELPPTMPCNDDPERAEESLMKAVPRNRRQVYKMRPIIDAVVDKGSFFEVNANFGRPIITGLARLEGRAVLLLASDPFHYGGSWTAEACQKVVRWVDFAETFHLPVVYLMDCPGFMIGLEAEKSATIRHGVRAMAAVNQTTVPWCTIIVRNAFGVAGVVHQPANRFSMRYAWPSAYWGSLPLEGGIEAAYRADIDAADDPEAKLKEIEDRLNKLRSPFRSAEKFWVEEVIDPRKTRSLLCEFARLAEPLRTDDRADAEKAAPSVMASRDGRRQPEHGALVHDHRAQFLRRRRRGAQPADRFSMRYAWPSAYWGSLPLEGGIEAAYRADIDAADDPKAKLKEIEDRLNKLRSPFRSAEKFWVEEIIDPRKTRSLLCEFARLAEPIRTPGPATNMAIGREEANGERGEQRVANALLAIRSSSRHHRLRRAARSPARSAPRRRRARRRRRTPADRSQAPSATGRRRRPRSPRPAGGRQRSSRTPDWRAPARTAARSAAPSAARWRSSRARRTSQTATGRRTRNR